MPKVSRIWTNFGTERLKAFSDGVFAIVITLLVLELKVPQLAMEDEGSAVMLLYALAKLWPKFASYFASFVLVGIYWIAHTNLFNVVARTDRPLLWLNNFYLMAVSLVAFSAALLGTHEDNALAGLLYGLNLMAVGLLLYRCWVHVIAAKLYNEHYHPAVFGVVRKFILFPVFAYALAGAVGFFSMRLSLLIDMVIPLAYIWPGLLERFLESAASRAERE